MLKYCPVCNSMKPLSDWSNGSSRCKACKTAERKAAYLLKPVRIPHSVQVVDGLREKHCSNCANTEVHGEDDVTCAKGHYRMVFSSSVPVVTLGELTRDYAPLCFSSAPKCRDFDPMGKLGLTLAQELGLMKTEA